MVSFRLVIILFYSVVPLQIDLLSLDGSYFAHDPPSSDHRSIRSPAVDCTSRAIVVPSIPRWTCIQVHVCKRRQFDNDGPLINTIQIYEVEFGHQHIVRLESVVSSQM